MAAEEAVTSGVEVDLERARTTQRFEFVVETAETENGDPEIEVEARQDSI